MTERKLIFLRRLASSVALWSVALWIIFSGFVPGFLLLVSSLALIGLWEYYTMLDHKRLPNFKMIGMICGALLCTGSFYYIGRVPASPEVAPFASRTYDFEVATPSCSSCSWSSPGRCSRRRATFRRSKRWP